MTFPLAHNWWSIAARGGLAVLFGVFTLATPWLTLSLLVPLFGAYALLDGGFNLACAYRTSRDGERWTAIMLEGAVGAGCGVLALALPEMSVAVLIYLLAFWAAATGGLEIAAGLRLRQRFDKEWVLALAGVASVAFGLLLVAAPSAMTVGRWLGAYALFVGTLLVALGLRLRTYTLDHERASLRQPIEDV